jgi:hypothetical protein
MCKSCFLGSQESEQQTLRTWFPDALPEDPCENACDEKTQKVGIFADGKLDF